MKSLIIKYTTAKRVIYFATILGSCILGFSYGFSGGDFEENFFVNVLFNFGCGLLLATFSYCIFQRFLEELRRTEGERVDKFEYIPWSEKASNARKRINIFITFMSPFTQIGIKEEKDNLIRALKNASKGTAKVRILILEPLTPAAVQRNMEVPDINVHDAILETLKVIQTEIIEKLEKSQVSFEVHISNRLPPFSLFCFDDNVSLGFYPRNKTVKEAEKFTIARESKFIEFINMTFEKYWEDSFPVDSFFKAIVNVQNGYDDEHTFEFVSEYIESKAGYEHVLLVKKDKLTQKEEAELLDNPIKFQLLSQNYMSGKLKKDVLEGDKVSDLYSRKYRKILDKEIYVFKFKYD